MPVPEDAAMRGGVILNQDTPPVFIVSDSSGNVENGKVM